MRSSSCHGFFPSHKVLSSSLVLTDTEWASPMTIRAGSPMQNLVWKQSVFFSLRCSQLTGTSREFRCICLFVEREGGRGRERDLRIDLRPKSMQTESDSFLTFWIACNEFLLDICVTIPSTQTVHWTMISISFHVLFALVSEASLVWFVEDEAVHEQWAVLRPPNPFFAILCGKRHCRAWCCSRRHATLQYRGNDWFKEIDSLDRIVSV